MMKQINVLLIEDNDADSRYLKEMLQEVSYGKHFFTGATNAADAKQLLQESGNDYDIVLTDLNLPDTDGFDIITTIQDTNPMLPIVVLTGQSDEQLALEILKMGGQDYLVKGQGDGHLVNRVIDYSIERKKDIEKVSYLANYDSLTGLANRPLFLERLDRALIRADRNKSLVALFVIDLDRFKNVNDTLGHDAGDKLLIDVAERLKQCTREGDTIARLGGDEFTIIMEDIKNIDDAVIVAEKVLHFMQLKFRISKHDLFITPSVGITIYPLDDTNSSNLFKNADSAMYDAKESGRNCYRFYTKNMNAHLAKQISLESKLRRAIDNEEFILYYQPKYNVNEKYPIGAEALIRWNDPEEGMIPPNVFIPLAEETGLIGAITDWVIKAACEQNSQWQQQGYKPIRMAINLSPKQFNQEDIVNRIFKQIIYSDLSPKYVELEITEGALIEDVEKSSDIMMRLKKWGIQISIDDFGTGYSSLSYLKKFPLDTLKIDQSFVRDLMEDSDDAAIVSAIIAMAKSLKFNVIAEGVENQEQLDYLATHGCNEVQGYLLGKPMPAKQFEQFLIKKPELHSLQLVHSA